MTNVVPSGTLRAMRQLVKHIPNILTWSRLGLAALVAGCLLLPQPDYFLALTFFLIGAGTDFGDGYLARKLNAESQLGRVLDPLADKLLVYTPLILLLTPTEQAIPAWLVWALLVRDYAVESLRQWYLGQGITVKPLLSAKLKTVSQVLLVAAILVHLHDPLNEQWVIAIETLWPLTLGLSLFSGLRYLAKMMQD